MNRAETKRPVSRIARLLVACALVAIAGSCRSPVSMSGAGGGTADFSIRFLVSGTNRADPDSARPRLILPSADILTVTLTATDGGGDPIVSTSAISGMTASVRFGEVPFGSYYIVAEASAGGVVLFRQASAMAISASTVELTLNLLPTAWDDIEIAGDYSLDAGPLSDGEAVTFRAPAGSTLLAASSLFMSGVGADGHVFIQNADGTLVAASNGMSRASLASLQRDTDAFITFYNGGSEDITPSVFAGPAMVDVPAGAFRRDATAANVSSVSSFSMGRNHVTRAQYFAVMGEDPSLDSYSSSAGSGYDPVQRVSWYRAIAFCNKLSMIESLAPVYTINGSKDPDSWGVIPVSPDASWDAALCDMNASGYRLPTDTEYAWAAMGASLDKRPGAMVDGVNVSGYGKGYAGSAEVDSAIASLGDYAWYDVNGAGKTHIVSTKDPNELGLYDMSGNVWSWCWDGYPELFQAYTPLTEPVVQGATRDYAGAKGGSYRILRGGTSIKPAASCHVSNGRNSCLPTEASAYPDVGFRVARSASGSTYIPRSGLVGEWLLNADAADSSGSGNAGTVSGPGTVPAIGRKGVADTAYYFTGGSGDTNIRLSRMPLAGTDAPPAACTISVWVNTTAASSVYGQMLYYQTSSEGLQGEPSSGAHATVFLTIKANNALTFGMYPTGPGTGASVDTTAVLAANTWVHVVAVKNGANWAIYLNGTLSAQTTIAATYAGITVDAAYFGQLGNFDNNWDFKGRLDDYRIYDRALSPTEILQLYHE